MFERRVRLYFTSQAKILMKAMPEIDRNDLIDWFANKRMISIGGGDLTEYLKVKRPKVKKVSGGAYLVREKGDF